jgi:hypothetical protein
MFGQIDEAVAALRPAIAHTYRPDGAATQTYERVYSIYRDLYDLLGQTHVELLHALKRIRTERRPG